MREIWTAAAPAVIHAPFILLLAAIAIVILIAVLSGGHANLDATRDDKAARFGGDPRALKRTRCK